MLDRTRGLDSRDPADVILLVNPAVRRPRPSFQEWFFDRLLLEHDSRRRTGMGTPLTRDSACATLSQTITVEAMDLTSLDRYSTLTVRYAQRHGDIVVVMSDRGVLFCRRESWQPWCAGVSVAVGSDDSLGAVRARLQA